jgi:hypothetical protein
VWGLRSPPVTNPLTALALPAYAPRAYTSRQSTVRPISSLYAAALAALTVLC